MLTWIALLVAAAALGYAWLSRQSIHQLSSRLDRYNRSLLDTSVELRQLKEELADTRAELRAEILRGQSGPAFRPDLTIREVTALHPQAQEVLASFHIGGCSSCAADPDDTLARVCRSSGADLEQVLLALNSLLAAPASTEDGRVKLPNVELQF